jgi:biopolymer transport protein ExbD
MGKLKKAPGADARYESHRKRRRRPKVKMQPPLTPMIDVTFLLLIFFLVAANFRAEANIPGAIPQAEGPGRPGPIPVFVIVRQEGAREKSKPVYVVKVTGENEIQVQEKAGQSYEQYRIAMAEALYQELDGIRKRFGEDQKVPAIIRPEVDYQSSGYSYVMWRYVVEAYNQARRAGFTEMGFQWPSAVTEGES